MQTDIYFWGWMILALIFFAGELLTAGFFLVAFGIGAAVAGIAALLGLNLVWQLLLFSLLSSLVVFSLRGFADKITPSNSPAKIGIDRVLGKKAVVIETIDSIEGTGLIRVDTEKWRALPEDPQQVIPENTTVKVLAVEGTRLVVRPISE